MSLLIDVILILATFNTTKHFRVRKSDSNSATIIWIYFKADAVSYS